MFRQRVAETLAIRPAGFRLEVKVDAAFDDWAALSGGAYLLRSNITDWSDEQLWKAYIQLTQAEAFRIQKDQLKVRPVWHQRADRVEAHILVCFLAFVLWKTLKMWRSLSDSAFRVGSNHGDRARECVQFHCSA
jgi:transposase